MHSDGVHVAPTHPAPVAPLTDQYGREGDVGLGWVIRADRYRDAGACRRMVLTEVTGDAELVVWDSQEFGHWRVFICCFAISLLIKTF